MSFFKTREEEVAFLKGLQKHPFFEPLVALMGTHSDTEVHELCRVHPALLTGEMDWFLDYWATNLNRDEEHLQVLDERRQVIERLRNAQQPSKPRPDVIAEVPFTPFHSRVKCIRAEGWTELQTAAFKFAFPAFFADEKPNPRWVTERDPFYSATGPSEAPYRYLRGVNYFRRRIASPCLLPGENRCLKEFATGCGEPKEARCLRSVRGRGTSWCEPSASGIGRLCQRMGRAGSSMSSWH